MIPKGVKRFSEKIVLKTNSCLATRGRKL